MRSDSGPAIATLKGLLSTLAILTGGKIHMVNEKLLNQIFDGNDSDVRSIKFSLNLSNVIVDVRVKRNERKNKNHEPAKDCKCKCGGKR